MENNVKEYEEIIAEVSKKYGYDKNLTNTLKRILPAMLHDRKQEHKELFYSMLRRTPIVVLPHNSKKTEKELEDEFIGDITPHIKEENEYPGGYGSQESQGAFVTKAIIDENLNLKGNKQFLYIRTMDTETQEGDMGYKLFGTDIIVPHLIHELGHAWNSEKDQYSMEGNILTNRVGTAELKSEFIKQADGTYIEKSISSEGLMMEEAINTNEEERALSKYMGIPVENIIEDVYDKTIHCSKYQVMMSGVTESLQKKISEDDIREWRMTGNQDCKDRLNVILSKTKEYKNRNENTDYDKAKKILFSSVQRKQFIDMVNTYKDDFFANKNNKTPLELIENCLTQMYIVKSNEIAFDPFSQEEIKLYSDVTLSIMREGHTLINQAAELLKQKSITEFTKNALKDGITKEDVASASNRQIAEKENEYEK